MHHSRSLNIVIERPPAAQALALGLVSKTDLLRLKVIARLHARGLPPEYSWSDLLQEAFARVLDGSRRHPEDVLLIPFLAGTMRSIKSEYWRRTRRQAEQRPTWRDARSAAGDTPDEPADSAPDPERTVIAMQELANVDQLFAKDALALQIIAGLAEQLSPEEICVKYGMSATDYESTRKRMRRLLLREGLRNPQP
jgi:RNA polymerase sigma-70 factor (ECF subfamily)